MHFNKALHILLSAVQISTALSVVAPSDYQPDRIAYNALLSTSSDTNTSDNTGEQQHQLFDALSSEGLVSVTDIPGFAPLKKSLMQWLHACIIDQGPDAAHVLETIQKDGTIRRSLASVTLPGSSGDQDFTLKGSESESLSPSCQEFSTNLRDFRAQVAEVTSAFSKRLTTEMNSMYDMPLMVTQNDAHSFHNLNDVVSSGDHLEHFHSYQKLRDSTPGSSSLRSGVPKNHDEETIGLHTDQGFFIAFVPGLMVSHLDNEPDLATPLRETDGFFIEKRDGTRAHVRFDSEDDLVFMMGDGVNQYVNPKMKQGEASTDMKMLRATPHSVTLPAHDDNQSRVWYGRMVLPPKTGFSEYDGKSYGEIRSLLSKTDISPGGIGCSSATTTNNDAHRSLSEGGGSDVVCEDGTLWCWNRCMSLSIHDALTCSEQNLQLQCINPRDQRSSGFNHGDYYPGCSNTTAEITSYTKLDNYPQDPDVCTDAEWETFSNATDYDFSFDLSTDDTTAKFMWTIKDGKVDGTIAFHGLFGFLAVGLASLDPKALHFGMNGASILVAKPSDEYDKKVGFDFTKNSTIAEHMIHETDSAFRHWKNPITDSTSDVTSLLLNKNDCFTSFSFEADGINSRSFNTTGIDTMLWAGNKEDKFAGYHGTNRAKFDIEWSTGKVTVLKSPPRGGGGGNTGGSGTGEEEGGSGSGGDTSAAAGVLPTSLVLLLSIMATFLLY